MSTDLREGFDIQGFSFPLNLATPPAPSADPLEHSAADVVRTLLIALGAGTRSSERGQWPVWVGDEPSVPDNAITVYDTEGTDDGRAMVTGETFKHYGFQVRVRSADYQTGSRRGLLIHGLLSRSVGNTTVTMTDGTQYKVQAVTRISQVIPIGKEATSKRDLFTLNATVTLRKLETS